MIAWIKHNRIGIFLFISIVSCACAIPFLIVQECNRRNEIPVIDVYPESQLTEQTLRNFGVNHMATLKYATDASHDELLAYFEADLDCRRAKDSGGNTLCVGNLDRVEYYVYIAPDETIQESEISYVVEIHWKGCSWDLRTFMFER